MNTGLARLIYKQATEFPETFSMSKWARETPCGTTACIAGWAMIFSGYSFRREPGLSDKFVTFLRPDGSRVPNFSREAVDLLGLTEREFRSAPDEPSLFYLDDDEALARLRQLIAEHE